jgi:hypothetical protein
MENKTTKTKSLVSKKERDLVKMFAGSADLVRSDKSEERSMILLVAKVFGLPAMCINIMGGLPYINKDGLGYKLNEYEGKNIISLVSEGIQYSKVPGERAIFKSILTLKSVSGGERVFTATGEADAASVKLDAVKATPNMMAETRSVNRVISKAIKPRILKEMYIALGKAKGVNDEDKIIIEGAVQTSAEEMNVNPTKYHKQDLTSQQAVEITLATIKKTNDAEQLTDYYEKIDKSKLYNEAQKKILIGAIAEQRKKNAKKS